jgi:hypothetical protein
MTLHLTDRELNDFGAGALEADEVLRVDDHLAACELCRRRAFALVRVNGSLDDLRDQLTATDNHLSDEDLQSLVDGRLSGAEATDARRHVDRCGTCAAQVRDLQAWRAPRPGAAVRWMPLAAAIMICVLIPAAVWLASSRRSAPQTVEGFEALAPAEQARVRDAIAKGTATLPPFLPANGGNDVRMGLIETGGAFRIRAPYGTSTLTDRPTFEWNPAPSAATYRVTVFDEQSNPVISSPMLSATRWTPADPLPRGRTYVWQVTATMSGATAIAPAAPAPPAVFHVVAADTATALERIETDHPGAHLALGILYMDAGVRDRAIRHLQQVPAGSPHADVAAQSLQRLTATAPSPGR